MDLGGTNLRGALLCGDANELGVRHQKKRPTERRRGSEAVLEHLIALVRELVEREGLTLDAVEGVGIATPGPLDVSRETITSAPNFPDWKDFPLKRRVEDALGTRVWLENDANAAALGEYRMGAGRGSRSLVFLGLGTGVGGGVVLDGRIVRRAHGVGGELGHIQLGRDGPVCGCGNRGCLEQLASATAVTRMARESVAAGRPSVLADAGTFEARDVFDAARGGDALANEIVEEMSRSLGLGIVSLIHTLDPEVVVIGGGLAESADLFLDRVRAFVDEHVFPAARGKVRITRAELGDDAGILGAAFQVFESSRGGSRDR